MVNKIKTYLIHVLAPALTTAEIKAKLAKGEAFHPEIEKAMKAAGIQPPPGRAPPTPKKVARGPPANKKAFHPANVAANIKAGQVPADIVKMAKDAGYIVPPNIGGKPAPPKRDLSSLYAREAEAEAEAEAYFEERDAYPEAYFEDDDLYARDADADAYFEERDAYYDEDIYA